MNDFHVLSQKARDAFKPKQFEVKCICWRSCFSFQVFIESRPLLFCRLISETDGSSAAATSYLIIPSRDVVSRRDGDALPPGPVPAAVRIAGEDALPASVAIATAVSQRQSLDLHRRANIQMSLRRKRCNRLYFLIQ